MLTFVVSSHYNCDTTPTKLVEYYRGKIGEYATIHDCTVQLLGNWLTIKIQFVPTLCYFDTRKCREQNMLSEIFRAYA